MDQFALLCPEDKCEHEFTLDNESLG